jgi:hypothetical protein
VEKYQVLLTKTYKDILLSEIEANSQSYRKNILITEKGNKNYTIGIRLTTIALIFSIALLFANQFFKIEKAPTKVQVVNTKTSTKNNSVNGGAKELLSVPQQPSSHY